MDKKAAAASIGLGLTGLVLVMMSKKSTPVPEPGLATLSGQVKNANTGAKISNVNVTLLGVGSTVTDDNGVYVFENFTPGNYDISFSKDGYESLTDLISVEAGAALLDVTLVPVSVPPPVGVILDLGSFRITSIAGKKIVSVNGTSATLESPITGGSLTTPVLINFETDYTFTTYGYTQVYALVSYPGGVALRGFAASLNQVSASGIYGSGSWIGGAIYPGDITLGVIYFDGMWGPSVSFQVPNLNQPYSNGSIDVS